MNPPIVQRLHRTEGLFNEAQKRQTPLVVSYRGAEGWHTRKALVARLDAQRRRLQLRCADGNGQSAERLRVGLHVGVAFRHGHRKCLCSSIVEVVHPDTERPGNEAIIDVAWPEAVDVLQRRAYYRTPLPESMNTHVVVWSGSREDCPPEPAQSRRCWYGRLLDISLGGLALTIPQEDSPAFACEQSVWTQFRTTGDTCVTTEARVKHVDPRVDGMLLVGLQFVGLELGSSGRESMRQLLDFTYALTRNHRPGQRFRQNLHG
jgi:hypothetical protein